ncbi:MAG: acyltransferase [Bacteriovorax sp.]|nr:acyltransferase [Bacteriovorax sp.]
MKFLKSLYYLYLLFLDDLPRHRSLFFVGLGNCLPDTFVCSRFRIYTFMMAGGHVKSPNTCVIRKGFFTEYAHNIYLGEFVQINRNCLISGHAKTTIGNRVLLSYDVKLLSIGHKGKLNDQDVVGEITIDSYCVIYAGTIVSYNTHIHEDVIVGAGSMVIDDLPANGFYAGNPAKIISKKFKDEP